MTKLRINYTGPVLPMTFQMAGKGTFSHPYYLDSKDPLVQSLDKLLELEGPAVFSTDFIDQFNSLTAFSFHDPKFFIKRRLRGMCQLIEEYNTTLFQPCGFIARMIIIDTSGKGLEFPVELVTFEPRYKGVFKHMIRAV